MSKKTRYVLLPHTLSIVWAEREGTASEKVRIKTAKFFFHYLFKNKHSAFSPCYETLPSG